MDLATAAGVFGAARVDRGTVALLRHVPAPGPCTSVVDLGTGYGPIAVTLALRQPRAGVWAVDVNERALDLARANAVAARLVNMTAATPEQVPDALRFDGLYSNPPIKIGKDTLHELLSRWLARLTPGATGWLVVKQAMGGDSLHDWSNDTGYPTRRTGSKQGYRLLQVKAPAAAGRAQDTIDPADLDLVNRRSGHRWSVLGHLAGGSSDQVYLLGQARQRAVLKIKHDAWWAEQLTRTAETVERLRVVGYPTPAVIGVGRLDGERSYLLTAFQPGRPAPR